MTEVTAAFTVGKHGDPVRNEDAFLATGAFFAVIDGATAKGPEAVGDSPGRRAAQAVSAAIETLPETIDAVGAVARLGAAVADLPMGPGGEGPAAGVVMLSTHRNEVWAVGDGWMMVDGTPRRFGHEIERRAAAARAALLRVELETTPVDELRARDPGRDMILPLLEREHLLANRDSDDPLVYGRLDGRPVPARLIHVIALPDDWRRIVLATDGYPVLARTLEESEALLAQRLRDDPLMIADPPATKCVATGQVSFDDRCWLEIAR